LLIADRIYGNSINILAMMCPDIISSANRLSSCR